MYCQSHHMTVNARQKIESETKKSAWFLLLLIEFSLFDWLPCGDAYRWKLNIFVSWTVSIIILMSIVDKSFRLSCSLKKSNQMFCLRSTFIWWSLQWTVATSTTTYRDHCINHSRHYHMKVDQKEKIQPKFVTSDGLQHAKAYSEQVNDFQVDIDFRTTMAQCTSLLGNCSSLVHTFVAFPHYVVHHCRLYHTEINSSHKSSIVDKMFRLTFWFPIEISASDWVPYGNTSYEQIDHFLVYCEHHHTQLNPRQKIYPRQNRHFKRFVYDWIFRLALTSNW